MADEQREAEEALARLQIGGGRVCDWMAWRCEQEWMLGKTVQQIELPSYLFREYLAEIDGARRYVTLPAASGTYTVSFQGIPVVKGTECRVI